MTPATEHSPTAMPPLDLQGTFQNGSHSDILARRRDLYCGERTYAYVRDCLVSRQAVIYIGEAKSHPNYLAS
ncbi:hypothetical protein HPB48_023187 [Haemaphysalis longicornis]|uniref:Uncharacterized protein n=1 Tax=Haemaphysalis longicornis TaxID=44386 RepID=A0A9J6H4B1_HAELO|nr:hypothetical protein HPB48_023187 [Haemaphysalis longicornis]